MLLKLLSEVDRTHFLKLAELLSLADKPLLWDGKTQDEVTPRTDMNKVSFAKGEAESKLLSDWSQECRSGFAATPLAHKFADILGGKGFGSDVEQLLLAQLESIPLHKNTADSAERANAVTVVLKDLLQAGAPTTPHAVRIMLYELMLMAMAAGGITGIEQRFLHTLKQHHEMDDCDYEEILERAETMYREVQKTIALVLE